MIGRFIVAALMLGHATVAAAQTSDNFTAGILADGCAAYPTDTTCQAYFRGITDAIFVIQALAARNQRVCIPNAQPVDFNKARSIFADWLVANPRGRQESAGIVAVMSLTFAYPCSR